MAASPIDLSVFSARLKQKILDLGFDLAGIASADPPAKSAHLDEWLSKNFHGEMEYLRRTADARKNIRVRFPWARTVVCVAARHSPDRPAAGIGKHIARYAQGDDYHLALERPLIQIEDFIRETSQSEWGTPARTRRYIDTGPVMEKLYAAQAGIGWLGKHTLVLNEDIGSYFFLAETLTDLDLPPDSPAMDRCGSCSLCVDACPTGAFAALYVLDATKCISYQTIETRGTISPDIAARLEQNLFGCDICQEACPWNRRIEDRCIRDEFQSRRTYESVGLDSMAEMTPEAFSDLFRKSPLKRPGLEKLRATAQTISGQAAGGSREAT